MVIQEVCEIDGRTHPETALSLYVPIGIVSMTIRTSETMSVGIMMMIRRSEAMSLDIR